MRDRKEWLLAAVNALRWPVSAALLKKAGSVRHEIRILTERGGPARASYSQDLFDKYSGDHFLRRSLRLGRIGILCCSNTRPCVREVVLAAKIHSDSPLRFGPDSTISEGFGKTESGTGKEYRFFLAVCRFAF